MGGDGQVIIAGDLGGAVVNMGSSRIGGMRGKAQGKQIVGLGLIEVFE